MSSENKALADMRDKYIENSKLNPKYIRHKVHDFIINNQSTKKGKTTISTKTSDLYHNLVVKKELTINSFIEFFIDILNVKKLILKIEIRTKDRIVVSGSIELGKEDPGILLSKLFRSLVEQLGLTNGDMKEIVSRFITLTASSRISTARLSQKKSDKLNQVMGRMTWKAFLRNLFDILGAEIVYSEVEVVDDLDNTVAVFLESTIRHNVGADVSYSYRRKLERCKNGEKKDEDN